MRWRLVLCVGSILLVLAPFDAFGSARTASSSVALAPYDWPMRPFKQAHLVRGYLDDPRMGTADNFHFGIDICAGARTPVYAVLSGVVRFIDPTALGIRSGVRTLQYWHITPIVHNGRFVPRHALLGWTFASYNHFHLSERLHGVFVNPLRPGALEPFRDDTVPTESAVAFTSGGGTQLDSSAITGTVDITLDAFDTAAGVQPAPWPVTPAWIRWRISRVGGLKPGAWHVAEDFRHGVLPASRFWRVYAHGTRSDKRGQPGLFLFNIVRGWDSLGVLDGRYSLEIAASDLAGNMRLKAFPFDVTN